MPRVLAGLALAALTLAGGANAQLAEMLGESAGRVGRGAREERRKNKMAGGAWPQLAEVGRQPRRRAPLTPPTPIHTHRRPGPLGDDGPGRGRRLLPGQHAGGQERERGEKGAAVGWGPTSGRAFVLLLASAPTLALLSPHTQAKVSGVSSLIGGLLSDTATVASVS